MEVPPFDAKIHLCVAEMSSEERVSVDSLRLRIKEIPNFENHAAWADDTQLFRFLVARNFDVQKSFDLITTAIKWRELRKPNEIERSAYWPDKISKENETGKIYCPGHDKWGRSILVFDNNVQNTKSVDDQMVFLAWNLEFAIKMMKPNVDKYLIFMQLGNFSFFNNPPMAAVMETISMLCNCYPERLGHCIIYQAPSVFRMFFNTIKSFLDAKTVSKMVFIGGDVSDGSANDVKLREIVGDNWKTLCGAEQTVLKKGCSPGYDHSVYWPTVLTRLDELNARESSLNNTAAMEGAKKSTATVDDNSGCDAKVCGESEKSTIALSSADDISVDGTAYDGDSGANSPVPSNGTEVATDKDLTREIVANFEKTGF